MTVVNILELFSLWIRAQTQACENQQYVLYISLISIHLQFNSIFPFPHANFKILLSFGHTTRVVHLISSLGVFMFILGELPFRQKKGKTVYEFVCLS